MKLSVVLEKRFWQTPDGGLWTDGAFPHSFWRRYLTVFNELQIVARVKSVEQHSVNNLKRSDGDGVTVLPLPYYIGPLEYLQKYSQLKNQLSQIDPTSAVIFRVPSQIASIVIPKLVAQKRPYALEVVGDPYDVFSPGAVLHPLRRFFRYWFIKQLRYQVKHAHAVSYVTETALQNRYPVTSKTFTTHYSSIELPEHAFATTPRLYSDQASYPMKMITVASLEQPYKAIDVLLDAMQQCVKIGKKLTLTIIGDGKYHQFLQETAYKFEIDAYVHFMGQLSDSNEVRKQLDQADLFVLPSRMEGLPRAMIEAMARGLPCIGSTIGGIPELLPLEDMVPPNNSVALMQKICDVAHHPARMSQMSQRNMKKAREYHEDELSKRRNEFYYNIKDITSNKLKIK
ncbi:hypothetical protein TI04_01255 [Achromatium sp. WMS2]|nr:hypothetical protein TI04_01255 [Achromatium sp. WMS2]